MKKVILSLLVIASLNAQSMCGYDMNSASKYLEKAGVNSGSTRRMYLEMALDSSINAKYSCTNISRADKKMILDGIKQIKKSLKHY